MKSLLKKGEGRQEKGRVFSFFRPMTGGIKKKFFDPMRDAFVIGRAVRAHLKLCKIMENPDNYADAKIAKYYIQASRYVDDPVLKEAYNYLMTKYRTVRAPTGTKNAYRFLAIMQIPLMAAVAAAGAYALEHFRNILGADITTASLALTLTTALTFTAFTAQAKIEQFAEYMQKVRSRKPTESTPQ